MPHVFDTASDLVIVPLHPHRDLVDGVTYAPLFVGLYEIRKHYAALGGAGGYLGPQVGGFSNLSDGGVSASYASGSIYWSEATGAHEISGLIRDKWLEKGGHAGFLGYPVTDAHTPVGVGGPGTRANLFQNGGIYWSQETGAHETHGDIFAFWLAGIDNRQGICGLFNSKPMPEA